MLNVWKLGQDLWKIGVAAPAALLILATPVILAPPALAGDHGGAHDQPGSGLGVVGLTDDQRVVRFKADNPGKAQNAAHVSGLNGDAALIGIDYRVQNSLLYGVGDAGGVYTINPDNGFAAKVSQLSVALDGKSYDIDFNPAANRLRVISDTGQSLRHNIDDPKGAPPVGTTAVDSTLTTPPEEGTTLDVTAAAYTNNDLDATTGTTLYNLNTATDTLVTQSPANAGTLAASGQLTVDAGSNAGFDIYSAIRHYSTIDLRAFATLQVHDRYALYEVNLFTGKATALGAFHPGAVVVDIAIPLNQY